MNINNFPQKSRDLLQTLLIISIPFICIGGVNYWAYTFRTPLMYIVFAVVLLYFITSKIKLYLSSTALLWSAFLCMICISYIYTVDKTATLNFMIVYFVSIIILFMDFSEDIIEKILKIMQIVVLVYSLSILISVIIPHCMDNYFWIIVNPNHNANVTRSINSELHDHAYSGFAREKAEAALIMNSGIAIVMAKYFSKIKLNRFDVVTLLCALVALIATGKRTLFIVVVVMFCLLLFLSKRNGKIIKFFSMFIVCAFAVLFILAFVPQIAGLFERFTDSGNIQDAGGRISYLWPYAEDMFKKSPLLGLGFASYNLYAFNQGFTSYGKMWTYYAHNVYKELLGELGIVGLVIFIIAIVVPIILTILYMRKKGITNIQRKHLMFALYVQVLFAIYSSTGNTIYQNGQIYFWLVSIAFALSAIRRIRQSQNILQTKSNLIN